MTIRRSPTGTSDSVSGVTPRAFPSTVTLACEGVDLIASVPVALTVDQSSCCESRAPGVTAIVNWRVRPLRRSAST